MGFKKTYLAAFQTVEVTQVLLWWYITGVVAESYVLHSYKCRCLAGIYLHFPRFSTNWVLNFCPQKYWQFWFSGLFWPTIDWAENGLSSFTVIAILLAPTYKFILYGMLNSWNLSIWDHRALMGHSLYIKKKYNIVRYIIPNSCSSNVFDVYVHVL